jgi:hypothetical protein
MSIEPKEMSADHLNRLRESWHGTADEMEDLLAHIEWQSRQLIEAHAIATTLRGELAETKRLNENQAVMVVLLRKEREELRAERDTLARRVAELEVLVKCPREEDHLRIDELTALLRICKLTIENARSILEDIDDIDEDDDANVQDILDRVDAALAADTQPVAGVESNRGTVEADGHNVFCTFRDDGECICGVAPSEGAESPILWNDCQDCDGYGYEHCGNDKCMRDDCRNCFRCRGSGKLTRNGEPYVEAKRTVLADTARITKEPK